MRDTRDDLATLGLRADASLEEVQRAYKRLAKQHHPDRGGEKEAFQRIKASADRLSGVCLSGTGAHPEGCKGGETTHEHECQDNVRSLVLLETGEAPVVLTLDEQQAVMSAGRSRWVALQAADEAFLCCCVLRGEQQVVIGSSRGRVHIVSSQHDTQQTRPASINAGYGPVLALVCVSERVPLLLASVNGRVTLLDYASGCILRSLEPLEWPCFDGIASEALCQAPACTLASPTMLDAEPHFRCATAVCVAGVDERCGGGLLLWLQMDLDLLLRADEDDDCPFDALQLGWRAEHEAPVYAVAAAEPSLLVAATGHACVLHQRETGAVLRRLAAGSGVLYALALSPGGDCLVAAGSEEVVHVFNFPSGTKRTELYLPRGSAWDCSMNSATINALAFLDDRTLLSGGYDAVTMRWRLDPPPAVRGSSSCPRVALRAATANRRA